MTTKIKKIIIAALLITVLFSFNQEKKLKVELSQKQWEIILSQLDNSTSPHNEIKITTGWLIEQLRPQVLDTINKK